MRRSHSADTSSGERPRKLNALTSLRFFAATCIVLLHSQGSFGITEQTIRFVPTSHAVSFFFVLSGFILTYVYRDLRGKKAIGRFLVARFARIWPLHFFSLLILLLLLPEDLRTPVDGDHAGIFLSNLLLVHAWIPHVSYFFSYNAPSWSISTEWAFYLLFPILVYRLERTWALKLCLFSLMALLMIGVATYAQMGPGWKDHVGFIGMVNINPLSRLFEFSVGMVMLLAYEDLVGRYEPGKVVGTTIELLVSALLLSVLFVSILWIYRAEGTIGIAGIQWLRAGGLSCLFFGGFILIMALEKGALSKALTVPFFVLLGEISFSIYMLHQVILRYYKYNIEEMLSIPNSLAYLYFWVILLVGSHLVWTLFERPSRKWILRVSEKRNLATRVDRGPKPSRWRGSNPGCRKIGLRKTILVVEVLFLSGLVLPLVFLTRASGLTNIIGMDQADAFVDQTDSGRANIRFGDSFLLIASDIKRKGEGFQLQLLWESLKKQELAYAVAIHLLDSKGEIVSQADYPQSRRRSVVEAGTIWIDRVDLPRAGQEKIGVAIYTSSTGTLMEIDGGHRDWGGKRLLIPMGRRASS